MEITVQAKFKNELGATIKIRDNGAEVLIKDKSKHADWIPLFLSEDRIMVEIEGKVKTFKCSKNEEKLIIHAFYSIQNIYKKK